MYSMHGPPPMHSHQQGIVLVTALVLLVVITLVAISASRGTTLDLQMTTNGTLKARAFESAEGGRAALVEVLDQHVFNAGQWPQGADGSASTPGLPVSSGFVLPPGLNVERVGDVLYASDNAALGDLSASTRDMRFRQGVTPASGQTEPNAPLQMWSDVFVTRIGVVSAPGSDFAASQGYEGLGKAAAGAGTRLLFDARVKGAAQDRARSTTGSAIRIVVR